MSKASFWVVACLLLVPMLPFAMASPPAPAISADGTADADAGPCIASVQTNYPKGQGAAQTGHYVRVVLRSVCGQTTSIQLNAVPIGGTNNSLMFDDGQHDDGDFGDRTWGSNTIRVATNLTVGYKRLMIYSYNGGALIDTGSVNVGVDNHKPSFLGPKVIYPVAQSHAKEGDLVRFVVHVNDTAPRMNVDAILVIDRSGSMNTPATKMQGAKDGAKAFVDQLKPNVDRAALFSFSDAVTLDQDFTTDKPLIKSKIDALNATGQTSLYASVDACLNYAISNPRKGAIGACVVLTDGMDTVGTPSLAEVLARLAVTPEIPVFTIGLGPQSGINQPVLIQIAQASDGGQYFWAPNPADLAAIYDAIVNLLINRPYPQTVSKVLVNTTLFSKVPTLEPLYDDGMHGDEVAGDDIYGSELIPVNTKHTGTIQVPIHAWDSAFNKNQTIVDLKLDNTEPKIGPVTVTYASGMKAKDGDRISITASGLTDSFRAPGSGAPLAIEKVVLNASSIGAGEIVMTGSLGTYTASGVLVATGGAAGEFQVDVTAYDGGGNTATESGLVVIDNDLVPPAVIVVSPAREAYVKGSFRISADVQDDGPVMMVTVAVTGPGVHNGTMDFDAATGYYGFTMNAAEMTEGTYSVVVTATDDSGNMASSLATTFRVDNTAPLLELKSPSTDAGLKRMTGDIMFSFQADDTFAVSRVELVQDGGAPTDHSPDVVSKTASFDHKQMTRPEDNGHHSIVVKAWDENGNEATLVVEYTVDNYGYQSAAWGVILALAMVLIIIAAFLTKPKKAKGMGGG